MAKISFSMRTNELNTLANFAQSFVDTKSKTDDMWNVHCVAHDAILEVNFAKRESAAKVFVPILDVIVEGTEFDLSVPKRVDAKIYPTVSFTVDTSSNACEFKTGEICKIVQLKHGVFPILEKYWNEQKDVRKIRLNLELLMNALKAFDKKKSVVLSITNEKRKPLYITQDDSKKSFVLPMITMEERL